MAVTYVGAIYATASLLLQRVYIPHADDGEIGQQHVGRGETIIIVPIEAYRHGGAAALQALIGEPKHDGRCAVVDHTGTVVDVIIADPDIYSHPDGHRVIVHAQARVGDKIE